MAIDQGSGTVEIGGIVLGPGLQRTTAATEAMYLLAQHVFDLGYRRYEWKCDSLNEPSRQAAARLGFTYEGRFRSPSSTRAAAETRTGSRSPSGVAGAGARLREWLDAANFVDGAAESADHGLESEQAL